MRPMPYKDPSKKRKNHTRYMREVWYPKNKSKHISYQTKIKKRIIDFVLDFKRKSFCVDCDFPGKEYPSVLDFDHISGTKKFNVSEFKNHTNSYKLVREEIKKCEIVCANCHRIRTIRRKRRCSSGS
jgi:hypothetical protein